MSSPLLTTVNGGRSILSGRVWGTVNSSSQVHRSHKLSTHGVHIRAATWDVGERNMCGISLSAIICLAVTKVTHLILGFSPKHDTFRNLPSKIESIFNLNMNRSKFHSIAFLYQSDPSVRH
jgi:hypothetical protein